MTIPNSTDIGVLILEREYDAANNLATVTWTPPSGNPQTQVASLKRVRFYPRWKFTVTENVSAESQAAQYTGLVNSAVWRNYPPRTCVCIAVQPGGGGFNVAPPVTMTGDGTGATATASINSDGTLKTISVTSGGTGYTTASASVGGGAELSVTLAGGAVIAIGITKNVEFTNTYVIGYRVDTWDQYAVFRNVDGAIPPGVAGNITTDGSVMSGNGWTRFIANGQTDFNAAFPNIT